MTAATAATTAHGEYEGPTKGRRRDWGVAAILLVAGIAICAVTARRGIQPNDEGLMLQAASRIAAGEVPYRDFWWYYPPGQPYLLAALWKLTGPSLLDWRVVRVLADALVAVLAWKLAYRRAPMWLSLLAWLAALLAMSYPSGPHPFPLALVFALGALLLFERHPAWAGLLVGACAAWRIEFAAYLGLGIVLALALCPSSAERRSGLLRVACVAVGSAALLYLPVVAMAGPGPSWDLLVKYPATEFGDYQSLPFPIAYGGPLNTSSLGGFLSDSAENLLVWWLPLVAVLGYAGSSAGLLAGFSRRRDWPVVASIVFGLGMAHYLFVRADVFHTAPLVVVGSVLGAWAIASALGMTASPDLPRRLVAIGGAVLAGIALAWAIVEGIDRQWLVLRQPVVALRAPAADGVRAEARIAAPLGDAVAQARRLTAPGEPIYVLGRRADITTSGAPIFYVLAERPNPTRYDIAAPGVVTSAPVQREIISDLRAAQPGVIVRWDSPLTAAPEPNRSGQSSGVRLLDAWIAARYREDSRYGNWVILVPRG